MYNHLRNPTHLRKIIGILIALGILYFLGRKLTLNWKEVNNYPWRFHLAWLFLSLTVRCFCSLMVVLPCLAFWRQCGIRISYYQGLQIFAFSNLGRYIPGKVGFFLGFIYCCQKVGIGKTEALLGFAFRVGFTTLSGILISLFFYLLSPVGRYFAFIEGAVHAVSILLIVCLCGIAIFICFRKKIARFVSKKVGQVSRLPKISGLQFLHFLLVYLILWCGVGIAFFLFVKSLSPLEWHLIPEMIGVYAMAWTVGFLTFITPAGLGIREGALSFLLSTLLPKATAICVALLSRFWYLTVELAVVGIIILLRWCPFIGATKGGDLLISSESRETPNTLTRNH